MMELNRLINLKLFIVTLLLISFNIVFVTNNNVMAVFSLVQFCVLLFVLLFKGVDYFLLLSLLFTSTSFDVAAFVNTKSENIYSITSLPFIGFIGYFILIMLALFFVFVRSKKKRIIIIPNLKIILKFALYVIFSGLIMSFICFLNNDNNIPEKVFIGFFKQDFASYFTISALLLLFIFQISDRDDFKVKIKLFLFTILTALVIVGLFSLLLGFKGYYGEAEILLMPLSFFYSLSVVFFYFDYHYRNYKLIIFLLLLVSLFIQFTMPNALGGKSWIAFVLVVLFLFYRYFSDGSIFRSLILSLIIITLLATFVTILYPQSVNDNLISRKISEAISLFDFTNKNYYENISDSPKGRIDEFINIFSEFVNKPYYSFFGKGYAGSIQDHNFLFGSFLSSFFSDEEYFYNAFVLVHESVNVVFLKFGILGFFLFVYILYRLIKTGFKSPFILIGFIWLLFFFGYSLSLGVFGICSLIVGLSDCEVSEKEVLIQI